jgi:hypothetical protein
LLVGACVVAGTIAILYSFFGASLYGDLYKPDILEKKLVFSGIIVLGLD